MSKKIPATKEELQKIIEEQMKRVNKQVKK